MRWVINVRVRGQGGGGNIMIQLKAAARIYESKARVEFGRLVLGFLFLLVFVKL